MQRMHYQENAWNEHSLFAFFVRNEFRPTGMRVLDELYGLRPVASQDACKDSKSQKAPLYFAKRRFSEARNQTKCSPLFVDFQS